MIVSLNWLATHIDLTGVSVDELARLLTFAGVEVEGIESRGVTSAKVVIGQIREFKKHPDADRLSVCSVEAGLAKPLQIVCGASNFQSGDKVPVALEGAVLPGDFRIKRSKMRGVESEGMLCSGKELGLSDDAAGLMILSAGAPVGRTLGEFLQFDTRIEIEVTPNRPDLLSHRGLARELSALTGRPLRDRPSGAPPATGAGVPIRLDAADACPFYSARVIRGIAVAPSPDWLRTRLESIGLRPINNVVDITNFVLHDLGQPLHAFDLARVERGIVVRRARAGEELDALDGSRRALDATDAVIADDTGILALAGVIGGEPSSVTDSTVDVLLESAWFTPADIRRTSRRLGLSTDSSYRFERGVDPVGVLEASARAAELIAELAGGQAEAVVTVAGSPPRRTGTVPLDPAHVERLLGTPIPPETINDVLTRLGLHSTSSGWRVPEFRADLARPVDLIEEIARVTGLESIPPRTTAELTPSSKEDASYDFRLRLKQSLASAGFLESRTLKLIAERHLGDSLGTGGPPGAAVRLRNPLNDDQTVMRPSLLPGLIDVAARNVRHGAEALRFFEVGTVFSEAPNSTEGVAESPALAVLLSGPHTPASWLKKNPHAADFFDLRGAIEALIPRPDLRFLPARHPALVLGAEIKLAGRTIGLAGQLTPARARAFDARHPVYVAEIHLGTLEPMLARGARFSEIPRFPAVLRDVALEVPDDLPHSRIDEFFARQQKSEPLLESVMVFDVFTDPTGTSLAAGRKSLAYSLTYRDPVKTLESADADAVHRRIVAGLTKALPVTVR